MDLKKLKELKVGVPAFHLFYQLKSGEWWHVVEVESLDIITEHVQKFFQTIDVYTIVKNPAGMYTHRCEKHKPV